jgi:hypothetical protein
MAIVKPHEAPALQKLVEAGREIVAHLEYNEMNERLQLMIAKKMNDMLLKEYNLQALVSQIRELLKAHNPNVTFYSWKAFNVTTERHELQRDSTLHDTETHAIAEALGVSLGNFYSTLIETQK